MPRPGLHCPGRILPSGTGDPAGAVGGGAVRSGQLSGRWAAGGPRGGGRHGRYHQSRDDHRDGAPHLVSAARPVRGRLPAGSVS
jgi:hypothetical protein